MKKEKKVTVKKVKDAAKKIEVMAIPLGKEIEEGKPVEAKEWKPEPVIEAPKVLKICSTCNHKKDLHYGGEKGHCNSSECRCLEFK